MPRNRLEELQAQSVHAPITEEEEMKPLKKKKKKELEAEEGMTVFLEAMEEVVEGSATVEKNTLELRSIQKTILTATHKDEALERRMEDLIAENKKLGAKVSKIIKREQEWVDALAQASPKKRQQHGDWWIRKTQVSVSLKYVFTNEQHVSSGGIPISTLL